LDVEFREELIEALALRASVEGTRESGHLELLEALTENSIILEVDWEGVFEEGVEGSTQ